jgi:putative membrane protein
MRILKVLLLIVFFFFCMIFFVQNTAILSTPLLLKMDVFSLSYASPEVPFYVVLLLSFVVGGIFSLTYFVLEKVRMAGEIKAQAARIASLEKELAASKSYSGLSTGASTYTAASTYEPMASQTTDAAAGTDADATADADAGAARADEK